MAWYSFLISSDKVVDNVLDKNNGLLAQAGSWLGGQQFTDEEKAEHNAANAKNLVEYVKLTLTENTVRSKTRRSVAIAWIKVELFMVLLTCAVAPFNMVLAKFYWSVATSELMFWGTMSIIGFFFGPYMLGQHTNIGKGKGK